MNWMLIIVIILVLIVLLKLIKKENVVSNDLNYKKLDTLFSPAERSFFGVLNQAVGEHVQIFGKVRVADVISPKKGVSHSEWQKLFNKISSKHFDYLLCDKRDLSVLCAIELDDKSHNSKKRKERDEFLQSACQSAEFRLVQVTAKSTYSTREIKELFKAYLPDSTKQTFIEEIGNKKIIPTIEIDKNVVDKACPKCSSEMIKKIAKKGKNTGNEFWACSTYPRCKHTEDINS